MNNDVNNNFVLRDYAYISQRESENDGFWRTYEKWFYYDKNNENYIIPTVLLCIVAIFTNPPWIGGVWCILIIIGALFLCHCNNRKLDMNPEIQKMRIECKISNEKYKNKYGKIY